MKSNLHVPIRKPEDIIPFLGTGEKHWRKGYSAQELAESWFKAKGFAQPVTQVLESCPEFSGAELLGGCFERDVDLRTAGAASQTDLMIVAGLKSGIAIIAVEGKVKEALGQLVEKWNDHSKGKERRLAALCETLGLKVQQVNDLRYQLLHRTASAVYEAQRYRTAHALMLVHSFSQENSWFDDFGKFSERMGIPVSQPNRISDAKDCETVSLRLGWVKDKPAA